jgi:glycosyltransferase involved in cell wall biosynthesis
MRVLWVTDEVPDPGGGGGSLRQYHLLCRIAARADVDLLLAGHLEHGPLRESLGRVVEVDRPASPGGRVQSARRGLAALPGTRPAEVAVNEATASLLRGEMSRLGPYDVVAVEHEWLAEVAGRDQGASPRVITLQNLLSARLAQTAAVAPSPWRRLRLRSAAANALRFERALLRRYDRVVTVSVDDARRLGRVPAVVPNGVDLDALAFSELPPDPLMVITATWSWSPNAEAAVWACRELLPRVRAELPGAELMLVGRQPPPEVTDLARLEGVSGHFDVPSVVNYLRMARVALVPLSVGSGTRIKALEAMAAGRPLVGTAIGLEGLGLVDGVTAHIDESPEAMAASVIRLCTEDAHARRMAAAARRLVEEHFSWDVSADALFEVLRAVSCR